MLKHIPLLLAAALALQGLGRYAHAADAPAAMPPLAVPHFIEETDAAGLQSRFEGQDEFMVGGLSLIHISEPTRPY